MNRIVSVLVILFLPVFAEKAFSQDSAPDSTQAQAQQQQLQQQQQTQDQQKQAALQRIYEPYTADEFPEWLEDLRRGEIILFGSFPFTFFFVTEGYDFFRLASNDFQPQYAPWPLKDTVNAPYTLEEQIGVVITAFALSLVIAGADYLIRKSLERDDTSIKIRDSSARPENKEGSGAAQEAPEASSSE